ncbi:MAG TPA: phage terminase large subunit, partial [Thermomicrobiales bacterium]|nr:phage terminase large subunit [Thermomicrobiales bacterium]
LFFCMDDEVLLDGPAGTGKSLACLKKLDRNAIKYPGSRQLIVRKTRESLTQTGQVTFENHVIVPGGLVRFHTTQQAYLYPNGSKIVVSGLDRNSKVMSAEYDTVYVQEATEIEEEDLEALTTRLRNGVIPHQQLIADCNPNTEKHWLNQRCIAGKMTRLLSRHEDNPYLWDGRAETWTPQGEVYIGKLERLSGVRYLRLRKGLWVAAEGQVYEAWDPSKHLIGPDDLEELGLLVDGQVNRLVTRQVVAGVDWGYTNPGVISVFGADYDYRLFQFAELYMTRKTIDWWIEQAIVLRDEFGIDAFICDPSEPGYIQQFINAGLNAVSAKNDILPGITKVMERLKPAGDDRRRFFLNRSGLRMPDPELVDKKLPICTADEMTSYVWPTKTGVRAAKERPEDHDNHGLDTARYVVAYYDLGDDGYSEDTELALNEMLAYQAGIA